ncbi:MAG: protein-(glutamine-N5) methyltransferase, release factor-specific [Burkholderiales bacterium RIFCSPLOWO2_12_FULL_61_40]|nr:MAG: protein-(glutamine-N5) methyltransferase, release factor-specific [Burkholderiales bacterium RIFCSPLOWO2_12_FULL_61_40]
MMLPAPPLNVSQALGAALALGLERLEAQLLLLHALGRPAQERAWLLAHDTDPLPPAAQAAYGLGVQRRAAGEPLAYITGHQEFYGLDLAVDARVLVPRADTETLVDWAQEVLAATRQARVLDLGTGSGAVALALKATRPDLQVSAVDFSVEALAVAQANAQRLQLEVGFSQGSWLSGVQGRFHALVSNPPYIADQDHHLAALTHEPLQALASGHDGLDDIRTLVQQAPAHLLAGGWLLLEHGYDQAQAVRTLLTENGFSQAQSRRDLAGIERCSGGLVP